MTLRLSIENVDRLPDGGPIRIEVKGRGLDLGRDSHLDWTLPDPSRSVSGKHCEIRYRDGGYWFTTSRQTAPSSTAPNTGSMLRTGCGTAIGSASDPT